MTNFQYLLRITEPSTVSLTRMYPGYLKILEIGWSNADQPTRWISNKFAEITKRSVRFLLVLTNSKVNLQKIKIMAWFEMHRYRKVLYHLTRFLKYVFITGVQKKTYLALTLTREILASRYVVVF